ncbi:CD276 antigen homolog [Archocentrus centrarchus]|uniref:CD276 antigen homolog n=1 Tax=Archocentrus centrarchus TaxID=63155 RepID=UPI0011EA0EB9|nr:CD276 antigen homolog [Archocentrus centrarchus]
MLPQILQPSVSSIRVYSILVLHLLIDLNRGESQVVGAHQPIVALVDNDIILPCHVEPEKDVTAEILEWTRSDLTPKFVHVWRSGQDLVNTRNPSYRGRTSLFINELKNGNISLKLSRVKLSDEGTYECEVPLMDEKAFVKLVVASVAATSPVISLSGIDSNRGGVVLRCESAGWYPEPELLWLDGEGNLRSAGPTETLRGPDDLYTVSSRVTVEKRHSNNITCRVQQKIINQSRETRIHVLEDFFEVQSSSSSVTTGLAVCLALCIILLILASALLVYMKRRNMIKTKRTLEDCEDAPTEENREEEKLMKVDRLMAEVEKLKEEKQQLQHLVDAKEQKHKPSLGLGEKLLDLNTATTGSELEKNQEADKKLKDTEELNTTTVQQSESQSDESLRCFQEQNQSSSANQSPMRGDIILEEVERNGSYLCLKNISREDQFLGGWELKLQNSKQQPITFKFKGDYTLRAGRTLTLRIPATRNQNTDTDDLIWIDLENWSLDDSLKIDLISNTGEQHRLK